MFHRKLIALASGAMALTLLSTQPVFAQDAPPPEGRSQSDEAGNAIRGERVQPGRLRNGDRERQNQRQQQRPQRAAPVPTPEENKAAAQAVLTSASVNCQVAEATLLGTSTTDQKSIYEATCVNGPGFLVVASTPPQTFNCLELAGQAETDRLRDPAATPGQQCTLPANLNPVPVLTAYAREAAIDCTVDQGAAIGRSTEGNVIYEVGCADRDGYWLEQAASAWKVTPCWDLVLAGDTCRYSTAEEAAKIWPAILTGTEASACDVKQVRRVGVDAQNLGVFEVKCAAGDGFFVRVGDKFPAQRVHACTSPQAAAIGGGCSLTTAAPAAASSEQ